MKGKTEARTLLLEGILAEIEGEALKFKKHMLGSAVDQFIEFGDYEIAEVLTEKRIDVVLKIRNQRNEIKKIKNKMASELEKIDEDELYKVLNFLVDKINEDLKNK